MNKPLQGLLQKEMTRKEFLATLGLATVSVLGFGSVLRLLDVRHQDSVSKGYGGQAYGR